MARLQWERLIALTLCLVVDLVIGWWLLGAVV